MNRMAAIYARVSSDRQRQERTIASQVEALREKAGANGWIVPEEWIFRDDGYTGTVLARPSLERLRDLAAEGQFDTILVYAPDRLSRRYAYQVLLLEEFSRSGVQVEFINGPQDHSPEGELLLQIQGMIAEYDRANIAERTRRGKRHKGKLGRVNVLAGAPYGYHYVKKTDYSDAYYEIRPDQAEVVRRVFDLYAYQGLSLQAITRMLAEEGIPTDTGKPLWGHSTVWRMLCNPAYNGKAAFGKTQCVPTVKLTRPARLKGQGTIGRVNKRDRPREEWIEIPVPALVDETTFELAQKRLAENKRFSKRRTVTPSLLQGMLSCNNCSYAYYRSGSRSKQRVIRYYRCSGSDARRFENGPVCSHKPVRQDFLDELVWTHVVELLNNPKLIEAEVQRRVEAARQTAPDERRREGIRTDLARLRRASERLLDAYQDGLLPLDALRSRLAPVRKREHALERELKALDAAGLGEERFLKLAESVGRFLSRLQDSAQRLDVEERQKVLRLVVKEILVGENTIHIKHSIPITGSPPPNPDPGAGHVRPLERSCPLRSSRRGVCLVEEIPEHSRRGPQNVRLLLDAGPDEPVQILGRQSVHLLHDGIQFGIAKDGVSNVVDRRLLVVETRLGKAFGVC